MGRGVIDPMPQAPCPGFYSVLAISTVTHPAYGVQTPTVWLASLWYPTVRSSPLSGRPAQGPSTPTAAISDQRSAISDQRAITEPALRPVIANRW